MVKGAEHCPGSEVATAFTPSLSLLCANSVLSVSEMRLQNTEVHYKRTEHIIRVFPRLERNILKFSNPVGYRKFHFSSWLTDAVR